MMQNHMSSFNLLHQRPRELWYPLFDLPAMSSISHFHQKKIVFLELVFTQLVSHQRTTALDVKATETQVLGPCCMMK